MAPHKLISLNYRLMNILYKPSHCLYVLLGLVLVLPEPAWADLKVGFEAYSRGDYETALAELSPLAKQGDAIAQYSLGYMYDQGLGVAKDYLEAVKWYRLAAEQGAVEAQVNLGTMYFHGHGVPQDNEEAVKWFRQTAEQGDARGQLNLGTMYDTGLEVLKDPAVAYMWYNLAGAQGQKMAGENRDRLEKQMTPTQVAEAQRLAREWKPKVK